MLRKFFILASLALAMSSFTGTINYFEGTITYEIKYESTDPTISTEILAKQDGDKVEIKWSGNGFSEKYNNEHTTFKEYSMERNLLSISKLNQESLITPTTLVDCSISNETIKEIKNFKNEGTLTILDIPTHLFQVTADPANDGEEHFTKRDYYFSDNLNIAEGTFKNCKYNSYDQIYSETNTLPLKMVFENAAYKVTYTAIKIEKN